MNGPSWYVGGETAYYEPDADGPCPCVDGGLLECYCHSDVTLQDARDWLAGQGVDAEGWWAEDVVAKVDELHPDGYDGFHDEVAAGKALRRVRLASQLMGRAA